MSHRLPKRNARRNVVHGMPVVYLRRTEALCVRTGRRYDAVMLTWIKSPVLVVVGTQLLFTTGDLIARWNMRDRPFALSTFLHGWFLVYFLIRQVAMFGQLYVFSALQLGKTMALFGATSIVVVNVLGILLLGEVLSLQAYLAVGLVIFAFLLLSVSP